TTGVLPSGRLAGDYSFDNLTASGNITANTLIGNLSVSQLTSGTLAAGRLAGDYAFGNLALSGNLTSAWVHANLDANQLTTGTVPDARLSGPYTFDSLTLTSNLTSAWVHANIDATRLTTGVLSDDRLQGAYTFDSLTVGNLTANTVTIPTLSGSNVLVNDGHGNVITSNITATELGYLSGVIRPLQLQINELANGNIVGSNITNLDANNVSLGVLPDARLVGDYSFGNLTLSGNLVAAAVSANLNASQLVAGTVPSARLQTGDYAMTSLTTTGPITAASVDANLNASQLSSGTVPPARLAGGTYTFESLDLTGNLTASTIHANVDASDIVTGTFDPARIDLEGLTTNVVPSTSGLALGNVTNPWSNLYATTINANTVDLTGNIVHNGNVVVIDLQQTTSNIIPAAGGLSLGNLTHPWSTVHASTIFASGNVQIDGELLDGTGAPYLPDFGNVTTDILPVGGGLNIGSVDRPWSNVVADTITTQTLSVGSNVASSLIPSTTGLDLGSNAQPWQTVYADTLVGNLEAQNITGELSANVVFVGGSIDDFIIKAPAGTVSTPSIRFKDDETVGLFLPQSGTLGIAAANVAVLTANADEVRVAGNLLPVSNASVDLGSVTEPWRDVYVSNALVAGSTLVTANGITTDTLDVTNVTCTSLTVTGTASAAHISGNIGASQITSGVLDPARIDGLDLTLGNLDVSGNLVVSGTTTLQPGGHVVPSSNVTFDLGNATNVWRDLYLSGSTIHLGNATISETAGNVVISKLNITGSIAADGLVPPLSISNVQITDNTWTVLDDTAVSSDGGHVLVNGEGFGPGTLCKVGTTNATSTSYVSASQLRCIVPAKTAGSYDLSVIRGDTVSAVLPSGITYSNVVTWVTGTTLPDTYFANGFSTNLVATSDSNVLFSNLTALPTQTALDPATGILSGNITSVANDTLFSVEASATDEEFQNAERTFLMSYKALNVSNVAVTDNAWTVQPDLAVDTAGGYVQVGGSYFLEGDTVTVDNVATTTTYVSPTALRAVVPAKSAGTYPATVVRNGVVGPTANTLVVNPAPVWVTGTNLGNVYESTPFTITLQANGATSYANVTALPPTTTLNTSTGALTGNISLANSASYTFSVLATNIYFQQRAREFTLQYLLFAASGGVMSVSDGYMYHTFTANGTLTTMGAGPLEYLLVGGGGGGGSRCAGGGGGGVGG
ncbi:MAG: beta strand repeat-containing protein, partial [Ilumatobacteraceae bacterium]